jgi:hypothetical protein
MYNVVGVCLKDWEVRHCWRKILNNNLTLYSVQKHVAKYSLHFETCISRLSGIQNVPNNLFEMRPD